MLNSAQTILHYRPASSADGANGPATPIPELVCVSAALRRLLQQADITAPRLRVATLEGEAGTGKSLLGQVIHRRSPVAALPFLRRDAREWLATDTDTASLTGTLYLDRVDLLPATGQALLHNLLKLLQNFESSSTPPRFLLLASSHASLRQLAASGAFLPDLAFRLTAVRFAVPPLRDHREDIGPMTQALIDRICRRYQQPTVILAPGCLPRLLQHPWPGNVRELASVLESAILEASGSVLKPNDLLLQPTASSSAGTDPAPANLPADLSLDAAIQRHIHMVLQLNKGNKLRTARILNISRSTLYRILDGDKSILS